jgi:hypothetical protein
MERYPTEIHLGLGRRLNLLVIESRSQDFNPPPRKGCGTSLFTIDQVKSDRDYGEFILNILGWAQ